MTPEQRAAMPTHTAASQISEATINRIIAMISTVKSMRRERWNLEYPVDHPERNKVPQWVTEEE